MKDIHYSDVISPGIDKDIVDKLNHYELLLDAIFENNLLSIMVLISVRNKEGFIVDFEIFFINRLAEEQIGRTGLTGRSFISEFPGTKASGLFDHYVQVAETGNSWEDEVYYHYNGKDFWASVKATKFEEGCLIMYSDITAQKKAEQELLQIKDDVAKRATDKYLSLFNNIDQGFCIQEIIFDNDDRPVDYRFLEVNPVFEKQTGLKNAVGRTIREFDPSLENIWFEKYGEVVKTGKSVHFQSKAAGLQGGVWYDVYAFRIDKPEDRHVAVLFNDITIKKKAEENFRLILENLVEQRTSELKASKDLLKSVLDSTTNGISLLKAIRNEKGDIIDFEYQLVNRTTEEVNKRTDLIGKRYSLVHKGFFKSGLFDNLKRVVETGITGKMELFYDEENFFHWFRTTGVRFEDGVALSFEDITERKKAEIELNEQNHLVRQITDTIPDILFVIDTASGELIFTTNRIFSMLGYPPEKFQSIYENELRNILHPEDQVKFSLFTHDLSSIKPEEIRETEFRILDAGGKYNWLNVRYRLFKAGNDGKALQVLGIARDVSKRIEAEMAFHEERNRNLELKRMNELMDTFVYAAAHDLKAPISNLRLLTELIETTDDIELRLHLQNSYSQVISSLEGTISGLIKVLEIEKDSRTGVRKLIFAEAYDSIIKEMHDQIKSVKPEIRIDFSSCDSITYVESYLKSIFRNLISNALKYRSAERKLNIDIHTKQAGGYVLLSFSDNGIGIDLKNYGKDIFKPFKRFSSGTEGSGIGLHLVKSIVTKNGGRIEVESNPGTGTVFRIYMVQYDI